MTNVPQCDILYIPGRDNNTLEDNMENEYKCTLEELSARYRLCQELLEVLKNCEAQGMNHSQILGTLEGHIHVTKTFCEIKIDSELNVMEVQKGEL